MLGLPSCEGSGLKLSCGRDPGSGEQCLPSCEGSGLKHEKNLERKLIEKGLPSCEGSGLKQGRVNFNGYTGIVSLLAKGVD